MAFKTKPTPNLLALLLSLPQVPGGAERINFTAASIFGAAVTLAAAIDASAQSVQYRSPAGVEYRSLADTDAIRTARAALAADPKNIARIIDLGVAESGARPSHRRAEGWVRSFLRCTSPRNLVISSD